MSNVVVKTHLSPTQAGKLMMKAMKLEAEVKRLKAGARRMQVSETELEEVLAWAEEHGRQGSTEHEDGTYEEGVSDGIRWVLGFITTRPDED